MTCYTFSVRPTIPESRNVKVTQKKFDEKENEDFCEEEYFNFEDLISVKKKHFGKIFVQNDVSLVELNVDFLKTFVKASSSQNLENSGF